MGVKRAFVTLHVGAGTFQPVKVDNIDEHVMHSEYIEVSEEVCELVKATKRVRRRWACYCGRDHQCALPGERASQWRNRAFMGDTDIFIFPGYEFKCVDAMITNFHLPESTLLMLVSAFSGYDNCDEGL